MNLIIFTLFVFGACIGCLANICIVRIPKSLSCEIKIPFRYFLVEAISGLFSVFIFLYCGISLHGFVCFIFFELLLIISFIDIEYRIIPNILSFSGMLLFFAASFLPQGITWQESLLGIVTGGGFLYIIAFIYFKIRNINGMGGGDIKLLALAGAFIGWQGVFFTIFLSSLSGIVAIVGLMLYSQNLNLKTSIPFGPFISFSAMIYLLFGRQIIHWYLY